MKTAIVFFALLSGCTYVQRLYPLGENQYLALGVHAGGWGGTYVGRCALRGRALICESVDVRHVKVLRSEGMTIRTVDLPPPLPLPLPSPSPSAPPPPPLLKEGVEE